MLYLVKYTYNKYTKFTRGVNCMAEFCLDCWNKINETKDSKWRYALSWNRELCEECGEYKRVIVTERFWSRAQKTVAETIERFQRSK